MARGINKVILVGNVTKDPESRGNSVASFGVATNEQWKDKDGNKQERTEFHRVTAFGKLAEIISKYVKKGTLVYLEGSIRTEKYTDKSGAERYSTGVIASELQMLGGGGGSDSGREVRGSERRPRPTKLDDGFDDEIPF